MKNLAYFLLISTILICSILIVNVNKEVIPTDKPIQYVTPTPAPYHINKQPEFDPISIEQAINQFRKSKGLTELKHYQPLCDIAVIRAHETETDWSHNGFKKRSSQGDNSLFTTYCVHCSRVGENLAKDFRTEQGIMTGWINSPTHLANLLEDYNIQCVGVEKDHVASMFGRL